MSLLLAKGLIVVALLTAKPGEYTEKNLCDLWAGAQCEASSCKADAKQRCAQASRTCAAARASSVPPSRADKVATCAKALIRAGCGAPQPAECKDVSAP